MSVCFRAFFFFLLNTFFLYDDASSIVFMGVGDCGRKFKYVTAIFSAKPAWNIDTAVSSKQYSSLVRVGPEKCVWFISSAPAVLSFSTLFQLFFFFHLFVQNLTS